eukprot:218794_1
MTIQTDPKSHASDLIVVPSQGNILIHGIALDRKRYAIDPKKTRSSGHSKSRRRSNSRSSHSIEHSKSRDRSRSKTLRNRSKKTRSSGHSKSRRRSNSRSSHSIEHSKSRDRSRSKTLRNRSKKTRSSGHLKSRRRSNRLSIHSSNSRDRHHSKSRHRSNSRPSQSIEHSKSRIRSKTRSSQSSGHSRSPRRSNSRSISRTNHSNRNNRSYTRSRSRSCHRSKNTRKHSHSNSGSHHRRRGKFAAVTRQIIDLTHDIKQENTPHPIMPSPETTEPSQDGVNEPRMPSKLFKRKSNKKTKKKSKKSGPKIASNNQTKTSTPKTKKIPSKRSLNPSKPKKKVTVKEIRHSNTEQLREWCADAKIPIKITGMRGRLRNKTTPELQTELIRKLYPSRDSTEKKKTTSTHNIPLQIDESYDDTESVNSFEGPIDHDIKTLTEKEINQLNKEECQNIVTKYGMIETYSLRKSNAKFKSYRTLRKAIIKFKKDGDITMEEENKETVPPKPPAPNGDITMGEGSKDGRKEIEPTKQTVPPKDGDIATEEGSKDGRKEIEPTKQTVPPKDGDIATEEGSKDGRKKIEPTKPPTNKAQDGDITMGEGSKDGRKEIPNGTAVDDENQSKENAQKSIQDGDITM